jgi:hypothetical protein
MENTLSSKNECAKTRPTHDPYEVWVTPIGEYRVLKKQKSPKGEAADPHARWFVYHPESGDMGDMYAADIKRHGRRVR